MSDPEQPHNAPEGDGIDEDAIDLSDMEHGIDGALAGLRRDVPDENEEAALISQMKGRGGKSRRSPALAAVVSLVGLYLLTTMWSDFRYWISSRDPVDLGAVEDIYREGAFLEDYDNRYVILRGTPDVQHAARMKTEKGVSGYVRIREAGGSLYASVPREDERPADRFTGKFQGRMRHLGSMWNYEIVSEFFNNEQILQTVDIAAPELARALTEQSASLKVDGEDREITLTDNDTIRLVVSQPDASVQMGKDTWKKVGQAEEALAALGYPFTKLERKATHFHNFVARIPEAERDAALAKLHEGLEIPADNPDPKVGAMILPRSATYVVPPEGLGVAGDSQIVFEYGDNTTSPGYRLDGGKLVERSVKDGRMGVELEDLSAVRVERQIFVDPDGFVIVVEEDPSKKWLSAVLFLLVCGLVLVNLGALAFTLRRL